MPKKMHLLSYKRQPSLLYPFMIGFTIGVAITNIFAQSILLQEGYFSTYSLERLQYVQIDSNKLFFGILQNRFQIVLLIFIMATTIIGVISAHLFAGWYGFSMGIMITVLVNRFGLKGSILFAACILPQVIFYVPAFNCLLNECRDISCILFLPQKVGAYYGHGSTYSSKRIYRILTSLGVVIIGILLESYVNPVVVSKIVTILKIM